MSATFDRVSGTGVGVAKYIEPKSRKTWAEIRVERKTLKEGGKGGKKWEEKCQQS